MQIVRTWLPLQAMDLAVRVGGKESDVKIIFLLSPSPRTYQVLRRNWEVRRRDSLYLLRCLHRCYNPQRSNLYFCSPEKLFRNSLHIFFMLPGTPTRCSVSYRLRGSPSLITPHPLPISNYASASPIWKSTGSYRFPNTPSCLT